MTQSFYTPHWQRGYRFLTVLLVAVLSGCSLGQKVSGAGPPSAGRFSLTSAGTGGAFQFFTGPGCGDPRPANDRIFGAESIEWGTHKLTLVTRGNEFSFYQYSPNQPTNPFRPVSWSSFRVPPVGDLDYNLNNVAACNNCRWGAAVYDAGLVLFDLGTGPIPIVRDHHYYPGMSLTTEGAFTYIGWNSQQFLIANMGAPCGGASAIYRIRGVDPGEQDFVECLSITARIPRIIRGLTVPPYFYLFDRDSRISIMEEKYGGGLDYISTPFYGYGLKASSISVDGDRLINNGMIYDISTVSKPVLIGDTGARANRSALKGNLAFFGLKSFRNSETTWDISNPSVPVPANQSYWDPGNPWNYPGSSCSEFQDALFLPGYDQLVLARFTKGQLIDVDGWIDDGAIFSDGFESGDLFQWELTGKTLQALYYDTFSEEIAESEKTGDWEWLRVRLEAAKAEIGELPAWQ